MKRFLSMLFCLLMLLSILPSALAEGADLRTVTVLSPYPTNLSPEEAQAMPMYQDFEAIFADKNIKLNINYVDSDQYSTVLQALIASNDMPDVFSASRLGTASCINMIENGKVLCIDDVLQYSDGTATYALSAEGYMYPCRQKDTYTDGKMYYLGNASMLASVDSTEDNFGYNAVTSNTYAIKVRKDWLDELNMKAPTTLDEFYNMLVAFQENDMNHNGIKDERMIICTGTCNTTWGGFFDTGISGWFGLAPYVFQLNRETWKAEVPFLQEGFTEYVSFLKKCIDAGVLYVGDNIGKNDGQVTTLMSQNVVSAYFWPAHTDNAGKPEGAVYQTLGTIVGKEGITPVMDGSRGWKSWDLWGFRAGMDPQLAADLLDIFCSVEWSVFFNFGVESKSYEVSDTGMFNFIAPLEREEYIAYGYTDGYNLLGDGRLPRTALNAYFQSYNGGSLIWKSYDEFLNSDYFNDFYAKDLTEMEVQNIKTWCESAKVLQKFNMNGDLGMIAPMATIEEAEILDTYETDLYTYMDELFANLLSGVYSLDDYQTYVDELYMYGLQEVLDVQQARYDRIVR